jgi:uncharacterized protein (DUF302 family)
VRQRRAPPIESLPAGGFDATRRPAVGTPLMQASRTVAIDLSQKMLVWADDEGTKVAYNDPTYLADRHGIDGQTERLEQVRAVLDGLATEG